MERGVASTARRLHKVARATGSGDFFDAVVPKSPILVQNSTVLKARIKQTASTIQVPWELNQVPSSLAISCTQCLEFVWRNTSSFHGIYADTFAGAQASGTSVWLLKCFTQR
jgi:hypothetical protein